MVSTKRLAITSTVGCLVSLLMMAGFIEWNFQTFREINRRQTAKLDRCNHRLLLEACRELAPEIHKNVRSRRWHWDPRDGNKLMLTDDVREALPEAIRVLEPTYIALFECHLIIGMGKRFMICPEPRLGVIAFAKGKKEWGSRKYIDGLWYYDGTLTQAPP